MDLQAVGNRVRQWWASPIVEVWHTPAYRLPLPGLEVATGFEPRRADFALWYLLQSHAVPEGAVRSPQPCTYEEMARVHTAEFLERISRPVELAQVFSVDPGLLPVDELLHTIRLAVGGTIAASRAVLQANGPRKQAARALNLLGGFHHAGREKAGGFCAVNDVAVAVAALRTDGFDGSIAILDLDAHPPDGTADCLAADERVWIGSISGSDWGSLPKRVDETVIPGAEDAAYLVALDRLLSRLPTGVRLAFVLAGGDVLAGDLFGKLALTLDGARRRDLRVAEALKHIPAVWLPAGGYGPTAWQVLAGTGVALAVGARRPIPQSYDPLGSRFATVARTLDREELGRSNDLSMDDLAMDLGRRPETRRLLLGFYSAQGLEYAFSRFGILQELERIGYSQFRVELADASPGERIRLYGHAGGAEHLLIEAALEKQSVAGLPVLYVHWLTLRHPAAQFSEKRPRLPDQEVPGLGMAREATELLVRIAHRLDLKGVAYRPSSFHTAYAGRGQLWFIDPARQGRFEALVAALSGLRLVEATRAVAEGRVQLDGVAYAWEPDEMVRWIEAPPLDREAVARARNAAHFTVIPHASPSPGPEGSPQTGPA